MFLEDLEKMIQVGIAKVLNDKVVKSECKHDGVPLVMPETRDGGCLVVGKFGKVVLVEVVCKDACLGETGHAMVHFKVDPAVAGKLVEFVFNDEFLGDVSNLDADVLWPVMGGVEIEIFGIHGGMPSILLGESTVD